MCDAASSPPAGRVFALQGPRDLDLLDRLDEVVDLPAVKVLEGDAALDALWNLEHVLLDLLERRDDACAGGRAGVSSCKGHGKQREGRTGGDDVPTWRVSPLRTTRAFLAFWNVPFDTLLPAMRLGSLRPLTEMSNTICTVASP